MQTIERYLKKRTQKCSRRNREDEPPWDTGNPGTHLQIEKAAVRLHERMLGELELLEREQSEAESWSENRLKQLTAFFKALQGMEEMLGRFEEKRDRYTQDTRDILEFRCELEKRIAGLVSEQKG